MESWLILDSGCFLLSLFGMPVADCCVLLCLSFDLEGETSRAHFEFLHQRFPAVWIIENVKNLSNKTGPGALSLIDDVNDSLCPLSFALCPLPMRPRSQGQGPE